MMNAAKIGSLLQNIDILVKSLKFFSQIGRNAYYINSLLSTVYEFCYKCFHRFGKTVFFQS